MTPLQQWLIFGWMSLYGVACIVGGGYAVIRRTCPRWEAWGVAALGFVTILATGVAIEMGWFQ